ncbi:hypothetical protein CHS0354_013596 [Potamilus streckersoni]|uniref:Uncharacterized protein n=1 Tax=Potamilus streckersoni TaxID=2493646 RepID=A0AAE0VXH4_9BIVA|nr:hypothetical protein CHS0354_013596 [Potamilus streckersoni]
MAEYDLVIISQVPSTKWTKFACERVKRVFEADIKLSGGNTNLTFHRKKHHLEKIGNYTMTDNRPWRSASSSCEDNSDLSKAKALQLTPQGLVIRKLRVFVNEYQAAVVDGWGVQSVRM